MSVLSRLAPPAASHLRRLELVKISKRFGGGDFRTRPGQFEFNRAKDIAHFYMIGIGFLPFATVALFFHIVYDYPEDDYAPRYWQYERNPAKQLVTKYFMGSDTSMQDRMYGYYFDSWWKMLSTQISRRVRHLQQQRGDYKGYGYVPVKEQWAEKAAKASQEYRTGHELWKSVPGT